MIPRLMQTPALPETLYPWRWAAENGSLNGVLALASLPRLSAALERADSAVVVALKAGIDGQGIRFIKGVLRAEVTLTCQRCLGSLLWPLEVAVCLGLARDEAQIDQLPEAYEPLLIAEDSKLAVADLVEDELLLALPQIPRHDDLRECAALGEVRSDPPALQPRQPFAALASLLQDSKRSR